jgi:hypothetical protein
VKAPGAGAKGRLLDPAGSALRAAANSNPAAGVVFGQIAVSDDEKTGLRLLDA